MGNLFYGSSFLEPLNLRNFMQIATTLSALI